MSKQESQVGPPEEPRGITRREALRKGALLGGALAWATPVVQVVGMKPALAQTTSPPCVIEVSVVQLPGVVICLEGPPELCDCINACANAACIGQCIIDFPPTSFAVGPCA
jgi:hypothetical protein